MFLTSSLLDEIRELACTNRLSGVASLQWKGLTLSAILELSCCKWEWQQTDNNDALDLVQRWEKQNVQLQHAWNVLRHHEWPYVRRERLYGAPGFEVCPAPYDSEIADTRWILFQERFKRSLQKNGFSQKLSLALSKAMMEMADNVIQHSGTITTEPALGIVGYHVTERRMTYAVADVGRGVLASLHENPKWAYIPNSTNALKEVVCNFATRRTDRMQGNGFKDVQNALMDLNGTLRFRSGDGTLTMKGKADWREGIGGFTAPLNGLQLSVICALDDSDNDHYL